MTSHMHVEMAALSRRFYSGEISEEEWALLQVHMAYCDDCRHAFLHINKTPLHTSGDLGRTIGRVARHSRAQLIAINSD
jgi:hypothetical protein